MLVTVSSRFKKGKRGGSFPFIYFNLTNAVVLLKKAPFIERSNVELFEQTSRELHIQFSIQVQLTPISFSLNHKIELQNLHFVDL